MSEQRAGRKGADEKLQRMLALVPWVAARDGPTLAEVCERFGCTEAELVSDLRPVPVGDDDARLLQDRREPGEGLAEVRELLGGCPALPSADERVPAQRDDDCHTGVGAGSTRPCSARTSRRVGSPTSCRR